MRTEEVRRRAVASSGPFAALTTGRFGVHAAGFSDGSEIGRTYAWSFTPTIGCVGAQFKFTNWSIGQGGSPGEAAGQNLITIRVGLSNGSVTRQLTFGGQGSGSIFPGGNLVSDPCPLPLTAGVSCSVRVFVSVATLGQKWPLGPVCTNSETGGTTSPGIDLSLSGAIDDAANFGYGPVEMFGVPTAGLTKKSVIIVGDSLAIGGGETVDMGWIRRGLDGAGIAWSRSAMTSNTIAKTTENTSAYALTHIADSRANIILSNLMGNDMMSGIVNGSITTLAQLTAIVTPYWNKLAGIADATGKDLWITTLTPAAVPGSPLTASQIALRAAFNDWVRTGAGGVGIKKVLDVGAQAETALNNSVWKTGYAAPDGIHITTSGSTALGAALLTGSDPDFTF
ncbi:hypothetical protein GCM10027299_42170 [Larkinella ripae]